MLKWVQLLFSTQLYLIWIINDQTSSDGLIFIQMGENSWDKRAIPNKIYAARQIFKKLTRIERWVLSNWDQQSKCHCVKIRLVKLILVNMKYPLSISIISNKKVMEKSNKINKCQSFILTMTKVCKAKIYQRWMELRLFKIKRIINRLNNSITILSLWWIQWTQILRTWTINNTNCNKINKSHQVLK